MLKFARIPQDTFETMQFEAGVLLSDFDPDAADADAAFADEDILCATTGDITISVKPNVKDMGEEINNCPEGMSDLMKITNWVAQISFTTPKLSAKMIAMGLGAADTSGKKITLRGVKPEDFRPVWWVGDLGDAGGFVAAKLLNAFSREGITITAAKNTSGKMAITLQGHVSIDNQDEPPIEFYSTVTEAA